MRTEILELISSLNTNRADFSMPSDHQVKITPF